MSRDDIDSYLAASEQPLIALLGDLCELIRKVDPRIEESIKWNAPSFSITEHFATTGFSTKGVVRLVLHTGATKKAVEQRIVVEGADELLTWIEPDRAVVLFESAEQLTASAPTLRSVLTQWIAQTQ